MSDSSDFDFMIGTWSVQHRRLKTRLAGCTNWQTFSGTSQTHTILGGAGNVEDNFLNTPDGPYRAIALRSFSAAHDEWAIWWLDARNPWQLDVPVTGHFLNQVGSFYADDAINELPIRVRFTWDASNPSNPRWEQAFSADDGESWETNWQMQFSRTS